MSAGYKKFINELLPSQVRALASQSKIPSWATGDIKSLRAALVRSSEAKIIWNSAYGA